MLNRVDGEVVGVISTLQLRLGGRRSVSGDCVWQKAKSDVRSNGREREVIRKSRCRSYRVQLDSQDHQKDLQYYQHTR